MRTNKNTIFYHCILSALLLLGIFNTCTISSEISLTSEETAWLEKNKHSIRFAPTPNYPPISYVDKNGNYRGITIDIIRMIEERLGVNFIIAKYKDWAEIIDNAEKGELDIIGNIQRTKDRDNFLLFTDPYVTIPSVIIARENITHTLKLSNMQKMKVAVGKGFSTEKYIRTNYPNINLLPVTDDLEGLQMVSFGRIDAVVTDLATASYAIDQWGINNLTIAGDLPKLTWSLRFATKKDIPILNSILTKSLRSIGPSEIDRINNKWIHLHIQKHLWQDWRFYIAIFSIIILSVLIGRIWIASLRKLVRQKTEKLRVILNSLEDGVIATDTRGLITQMNPSAESLTGWNFVDAKGMDLSEVFNVIDSSSGKPVDNPIAKYLSNKVEMDHTEGKILIARNGVKYHIEDSAEPILSDAGRTIGLVLMIRDISEQKQAQDALTREYKRFSTVLDTLDALVYVADMDSYDLLFMNAYGKKLFGEYEGKKCFEVLQANQNESCDFCTNKYLVNSNGEPNPPYIWEFQNTINNEWYECRDMTIRWTDDRLVRMEIATNITKRKKDEEDRNKLENQLQHSQRMEAIGQLAGGVAHDFNNMLGGIIGATELLKTHHSKDPSAIDLYDMILESAERAADLTRQLLEFSRKQHIASTNIDLHKAINDSVGILTRTIDRRISIETKLTAQKHIISGDRAQLQSVFMNFGINAAQSITDTGKIEISSKNIYVEKDHPMASIFNLTPGEFIEIEFKDTGSGIPASYIDKIFEPFFTTKEQGKGTGLGLAAVFGTIQQHKGAIDVKSVVGKGTVFHILLPLSQNDATPKKQANDEFTLGTGKILIVDDEPIMRLTASEILNDLGYKVMLAEDGQKALMILDQSEDKIDLVIIDMIMPVMNGKDCFKQIRKNHPDVRVILSSGFSEDKDIKSMKENGLNAFIKKPFRKKDLSKIVDQVLNS